MHTDEWETHTKYHPHPINRPPYLVSPRIVPQPLPQRRALRPGRLRPSLPQFGPEHRQGRGLVAVLGAVGLRWVGVGCAGMRFGWDWIGRGRAGKENVCTWQLTTMPVGRCVMRTALRGFVKV